jgi:hypothetical protein
VPFGFLKVVKMIEKKEYSKLWPEDQLQKEMGSNIVFNGFSEVRCAW